MFSKMIRIFISSTFVNFIEERNRFIQIFKELSAFCKAAGFSFQVLDLRWGITDEDSRDNRTLQICLDEIARCQALSPKPNFLILAGMYYGWIPLPPSIPEDVWDRIEAELPASSPLRDWYLQDNNDAKRPYVLRPRTDEESTIGRWKEIEGALKEELFPLVHKYFPDKESYYGIWGLSATEQEIYRGLFCCPENKSHVFALMRTWEPQSCQGLEPESMKERAATLQEHIKDTMGTFARTNILSYAPGDDYAGKIKDFLKQVIQDRIDETAAREKDMDLFSRELQALQEAARQSEADFMDTGHDTEKFLEFCRKNSGRAVLLMGQSGSGKSTLVKHCYVKARGKAVLSCADILPSCSSVSYALWFCLKQLEAGGFIPAPDSAPDARQCVAWLEKHLQEFHSSVPVTVFLDCAEQIYDWGQIGGSLLECRLPENLTFVISCIAKDSLNQRDCSKKAPFYQLALLPCQDSTCLLEHLLHNRGRVLRQEDKDDIAARLPGTVTPLYIQSLCRQLQKKHSFGQEPIELPRGTKESIYRQLESQSRNYPVLFCHSIGYIALASDGLSEQELLALLERDMLVSQEAAGLSHWETGQKSFPLSVLWARIFYELKDYFSEADSNGIRLLRFHHALVREAAMELAGAKRLMALSHNMGNYFAKEPAYLAKAGESVLVNTRRLRELFPAFRYRGNWKAAAKLLESPEYVDGYLRCGWYRELMMQFTELKQHRSLSGRHQELLSLLKRKAMQFQLWGGSFLPAAAGMGLYPAGHAAGFGYKYVLRGEPGKDSGKKQIGEEFQFPNAADVKIGVKEDGTLAVLDGKVLKKYDLGLHSEIYSRCYLNVSKAFLYWKGNRLIVRDNSCRLTFWDTGRELVLEKNEKAPPLVDLYDDSLDKIIRAGGLDERDNEGARLDTVFQYQSGGELKDTELFYPDAETIQCFCHGALCAVLLNQKVLEIVDLDKRLLLASYPVPNACSVYWNPQGTQVLAALERDAVLRFSCSYGNPKPLPGPDAPMKKHAKEYLKRTGRIGVLKVFQFSGPVHGQDTPAYIGSSLGSRRPMYAVFSIQSDRLACYYYYLNEGTIRLFRLSDRKFLAESKVDPVFWEDSAGVPVYFRAGGLELVLISRGRQHVWDMGSLKWRRGGKQEADSIPFAQVLRQKYASCMEPWLPSKERAARERNLLRRFVQKAVLALAVPFIRSSQVDRDHTALLRKKMQQIPVLESGGLWWILDCYHSMVHVCDKEGHWLCHEQLSEEIFDFNIVGRDVYALPVSLSGPIRLQLVPINALASDGSGGSND